MSMSLQSDKRFFLYFFEEEYLKRVMDRLKVVPKPCSGLFTDEEYFDRIGFYFDSKSELNSLKKAAEKTFKKPHFGIVDCREINVSELGGYLKPLSFLKMVELF